MSPLEQYNSIIYFRQQYPLVKGERHHIIPKSCGGPAKAKWNIVRLTSEEHIECHRLLTLIYPNGDEHRAMCAAYALMCTSRSKVKVSDEQAAEARRMMAESKKGRTTWMKGRHHTEESKQKQREIKLGKRPSAETRKKMGDAHRGKPNLGRKGKAPWNKGKHLDMSARKDPITGRWVKVGNNS